MLGRVAGWARAGLTGLASRRVAGSAGPEPRTKKHFFSDFRNCQHIFDKNGPMELDADKPRKFQGPPDRIGWGGKILVGGLGGEKRRFSLEKRSERPWPLWGRGESQVWGVSLAESFLNERP